MSSVYSKKRSWQSLIGRLPGKSSQKYGCYSLSRDRLTATYHTGTYYGFATDLGQLRFRFNRQCLYFDLESAKLTWQEDQHTVMITWAQLERLKRRSSEAIEFIFRRDNMPSAVSRLLADDTTTKVTINFAMGASGELLDEMRLIGCVRKVRYGFWKLRKCYVPVQATEL